MYLLYSSINWSLFNQLITNAGFTHGSNFLLESYYNNDIILEIHHYPPYNGTVNDAKLSFKLKNNQTQYELKYNKLWFNQFIFNLSYNSNSIDDLTTFLANHCISALNSRRKDIIKSNKLKQIQIEKNKIETVDTLKLEDYINSIISNPLIDNIITEAPFCKDQYVLYYRINFISSCSNKTHYILFNKSLNGSYYIYSSVLSFLNSMKFKTPKNESDAVDLIINIIKFNLSTIPHINNFHSYLKESANKDN